jgi:hypothetical protein
MVKYFALLAVVGTLFCVDLAEARGRRDCTSCGGYVAGGCPGGVCAVPVVPVAPAKGAMNNAPPAPVAEAGPAVQPAAAVPVSPTRYYAATRRGLFGRR